MRFWDASAVVPLLLEQPASTRARALLAQDPEAVVWWATPVECASALARLRREGAISMDAEAHALAHLSALVASWYEVLPGTAVRDQSLRVLRLHTLRAADALQLAAALEWAGSPATGTMVTFDERLGAAAMMEGFAVEGWTS